jgi:hypothetical protein
MEESPRDGELKKKREELARVQERFQAPDARARLARELRMHVDILVREIAELEQA